MPITVRHIKTIITAVDAGWTPAEIVDDVVNGMDHFGLGDLAALPSPEKSDTRPAIALPSPIQTPEPIIPVIGIYNRSGAFDLDDEDTTTLLLSA